MEKEKELASRKAIYEQYEKELDATEKRLVERAKQLNSMTMLLDSKCTNGVLLSMALLQKEIANKYFAMGYNRCKKHITIDVLKNFSNGKREILLDPVAIGYSKTTDKDRCYVLAESIKDTKKKIESGEYKMCNLDDPEFKIELD